MQTLFLDRLKPLLSSARFEAYRSLNGSDEDALCRYLWNIALSESPYPVFQCLEVGFRNAVHTAIGTTTGPALGTTDWLTASKTFLSPLEQDAVASAKHDLQQRKKPLTEPSLISELKFGFWTSLLDARYDRMWHKIIKQVFPGMPNSMRTRIEASARMNKVRRLRNAVSHHHSIWHWKDLPQQHADAHVLIGWISDTTSQMVKALDRFPATYQAGPASFLRITSAFAV